MAKQKIEVVDAEFQIIETKLVPATAETKGVQLFSPDNKEKVIQAFINAASLSFSATPAQCKKLVKESSKLTIIDKDDKDGYKKVYEKHREFVKVRTGTEKERKVLTDPFNQIKSGIDKVAKDEILSFTEKEEARLKSLVDQWKIWEQEEAERIEAEAAEALKIRVDELERLGIIFDGNFYSVGTVSVDIVTIQNLNDEAFSELKARTEAEGKRIAEEKRISDLNNERKNELLDFWAFLSEEEKVLNFGEMNEELFYSIKSVANMKKVEFENEKKRQEEEKENQAKERKALNYEKRSFKLEKEGFEIDEDGNLLFLNAFGSCRWDKSVLESLTNEEFDERFIKSIHAKKDFEQQAISAEEESKQKAKDEAVAAIYNSRIDVLLKEEFVHKKEKQNFVYGLISISENTLKTYTEAEWLDVLVDIRAKKAQLAKEAAKAKEEERLEKLPEIEKATNYIDLLVKMEIPALKQSEINEILSELKNDLKLATEKAIIKLEKLK
jgi:hypothetical protein